MKALARSVFFFSLILSASFMVSPCDVQASTDIDSDINTDTTWDADGSPYVVSNEIQISSGATLTILPGTVVLFDYGANIDVLGNLISNGESDNKVYFSSLSDNTLNPEADPDILPTPGDYIGLSFEANSAGSISNSEFKYGETPLLVDYSTSFSHSNNTFDQNIYNGIGMTGGLHDSNYTFSNDDSSYILFSDISFGNNNTLTIMPGVTLQADNGQNITFMGGKLSALGNEDSKITFDGVYFQFINKATSEMSNVEIKNTNNIAMVVYNDASVEMDSTILDNLNGSGIYVIGSTLDVKNSTIRDFDTYGAAITVFNNATTTIQNSTIENGGDGIVVSNHGIIDADKLVLKNLSDLGIIGYGSDTYDNNFIKLRNSEITENNIGILPLNYTNVDISNNRIYGNGVGVLASSDSSYDFLNNWWGDKSGPQNLNKNPEGKGDLVSDSIIFDPWLKHDPSLAPVRTPVLIVPGVLGTEISKPNEDGTSEKLWLDLVHNLTDISDQFMDPLQFDKDLKPTDSNLILGNVIKSIDAFKNHSIFDYSQALINEFKDIGYTENTDLFLFPYDWRYGVNEDNIQDLKNKIADIIDQTGSEKVDIVAHSTGGLLVKKYVMENPSSNNIDKAVFVGVPNTGSPKAIKTFLQGDNFGNLFLADSEMKKIAENLPVVYDLSPSAEYYKNKGSFVKVVDQKLFSSKKVDLTFDDMTNFLINDHNLNEQAWTNAKNLHTSEFDNYDMRTAGVDVYAIDGCKTGTLGTIKEIRSKDIFGNPFVSYNSPTLVPGDSTVPLESATNLPIDEDHKFYSLNASHGEMLSQDGIRQKITDIVSGNITSTSTYITQDITKCKLNGRAISVYSPLSIDITDQNGNHAGLIQNSSTFEDNIPNADYEIMGEHKFIYLPTDDNQNYIIKISGTGEGAFTLTDTGISDNQITGMQVFNQVPVTTSLVGNVNIGDITTLTLDTNSDGVIEQTIKPTANLNANEALDFDPIVFANSIKTNNSNSAKTQVVASPHSGGYAFQSTTTIDMISTTTPIKDETISTSTEGSNVQNIITDNLEKSYNVSESSVIEKPDIPENKATETLLLAEVQKSNIPVKSPYLFWGSLVGLLGSVYISKKISK